MDWLKVKIYTAPKGCEIVSAALYAMGIYGLEIFNPDDYKMPQKDYTWDYIDEEVLEKQQEEAYVCAYVGDTASGVEQLCEIRSAMERIKREICDIDLGRLAIEVSNMKNEDWTNNWKMRQTMKYRIQSKRRLKAELKKSMQPQRMMWQRSCMIIMHC